MTKKRNGAANGAARTVGRAPPPDRIRDLNDTFRATFRGGRVVITAGVEALGPDLVRALLAKVSAFDKFEVEDDPLGEHDFGAIDLAGERCFWKIDYYDQTLTAGSPDPADEKITARVMTVMLASEY